MFSYTLGLRAGLDQAEIEARASASLGARVLDEVHELHPGLFVAMEDSSNPIRREVYATFLGAPFAASLHYSMNYDDWERLRTVMAVSAARLAVETNSLAFMTFDLESLIMRRTDGVLYLYESFGNTWREPEVISQIPQPWVITEDVNEGTPPGGSPYA